MQNVTYELKYCERCGSLGARRTESAETYCEPCGQILLNYSFPEKMLQGLLRKTRTRKPIPVQLHSAAELALSFGGQP